MQAENHIIVLKEKKKTLQEAKEINIVHLLQVQTRQWSCNNPGTVSCNCGAIVRDHNSIIVFSCYGNPRRTQRDFTTPLEVDIPGTGCLASGVTLKQLIKGFNSKYEVRLLITFCK